jgi:hypothetical protein
MPDETLSNLSSEERRFEPPAGVTENANVKEEAYDRAASDREAFWATQAERLDWGQKWDRAVDWDNPPVAKGFTGGTINAAYNCVDRHVEAGNGNRVAIHWVGEPEDDTRDLDIRGTEGRSLNCGQPADRAGGVEGRPGRHLPVDDPGDGDRDAGMCAAQGAAQGGIRRVLGRRPGQPRGRLRGEGDHR